MKATKVKIRYKKLKGGKLSILLDYYPPILNPNNGKLIRFESTGLHLYETPKNKMEREHNTDMKARAEALRTERHKAILNKQFGFLSDYSEGSFFGFFKTFAESKTFATKRTYMQALQYLKKFHKKPDLTFAELSTPFFEHFQAYLSKLQELSDNTKWLYFTKVKSVLKEAYKKDLLQTDISGKLDNLKQRETQKTYLTKEELQILARTYCPDERVKRAALFSALTGLRISDVLKLQYQNITQIEGQYFITYRQQKTDKAITQPISKAAFQLTGTGGEPEEYCFPINYSTAQNILKAWVKASGIEKPVTFHTFRHTFATVLLTEGIPLEVVQKMLGHSNISQTLVYAKIVDSAKIQAANKMDLDLEI
jgi:integrase